MAPVYQIRRFSYGYPLFFFNIVQVNHRLVGSPSYQVADRGLHAAVAPIGGGGAAAVDEIEVETHVSPEREGT